MEDARGARCRRRTSPAPAGAAGPRFAGCAHRSSASSSGRAGAGPHRAGASSRAILAPAGAADPRFVGRAHRSSGSSSGRAGAKPHRTRASSARDLSTGRGRVPPGSRVVYDPRGSPGPLWHMDVHVAGRSSRVLLAQATGVRTLGHRPLQLGDAYRFCGRPSPALSVGHRGRQYRPHAAHRCCELWSPRPRVLAFEGQRSAVGASPQAVYDRREIERSLRLAGTRPGEALGLQAGHMDFGGHGPQIERAIDKRGNVGLPHTGVEPGQRARVIGAAARRRDLPRGGLAEDL